MPICSNRKCSKGFDARIDLDEVVCPYCGTRQQQNLPKSYSEFVEERKSDCARPNGAPDQRSTPPSQSAQEVRINEAEKRVELIDSTCVYCRKRRSASNYDNPCLTLHRKRFAINVAVARFVAFKKLTIEVPRCKECKSVHMGSRIIGLIAGLIIAGIVYGICISMFGELGKLVGILPALAMLSLFGGYVLPPIIAEAQGIPSIKRGAERCKFVSELIRDGWTFDDP